MSTPVSPVNRSIRPGYPVVAGVLAVNTVLSRRPPMESIVISFEYEFVTFLSRKYTFVDLSRNRVQAFEFQLISLYCENNIRFLFTLG